MTALLLAHAASTFAMTGLIWFVQLVHYPLFPYADRGEFTAFAREHRARTTWVVAPLMLIELVAATGLLFTPLLGPLTIAGWLLLASIWLSTALVQVRLHGRLARGFDADTARRLVRTNWWRTVAWSMRAAIAVVLLAD